jgi:hypothetical protein
MNRFCFSAAFLAVVSIAGFARAGEAVQIDASSVFNMRPVSTIVAGKLVPMTGDIDGAGGVATKSAAKAQGMDDPFSMPDDGVFPANDKHVLIVMPYAKDDGKSPQARTSRAEDTFIFPVPPKNYSNLWLFLASGRGPSDIAVKMKYKDGTTETRKMQVPDWFWELKPDDADRCYVATDLSKWGPEKQLEKNHHYIFGLNIRPNPAKVLTNIGVTKTKSGIMAFFGATGEVAAP